MPGGEAWQVRHASRLGLGLPVVALRGGRIAAGVAHRAVAQVLREADLGEIDLGVSEAPDRVLLAALAGVELLLEQLAGVDLVDHRHECQDIAAVGVGRAGVVADHAILRVHAATTVHRELVVAGVAARDIDHLAGLLGRDGRGVAGCVKSEIECRIDTNHGTGRVGVGELDRDAMRAPGLEGDAVGLGRILDVRLERVGVVAVRVENQLSCGERRIRLFRIGRRLHRARQHRMPVRADRGCRRLLAIDIALPLIDVAVGARHQLGNGEAGVRQAEVGLLVAARDHGEIHLERAVRDRRGRNTGCLHDAECRRRIDRRVIGSNGRRSVQRLLDRRCLVPGGRSSIGHRHHHRRNWRLPVQYRRPRSLEPTISSPRTPRDRNYRSNWNRPTSGTPFDKPNFHAKDATSAHAQCRCRLRRPLHANLHNFQSLCHLSIGPAVPHCRGGTDHSMHTHRRRPLAGFLVTHGTKKKRARSARLVSFRGAGCTGRGRLGPASLSAPT